MPSDASIATRPCLISASLHFLISVGEAPSDRLSGSKMTPSPKGAPGRVATYSDPALMRKADEDTGERTGAIGATNAVEVIIRAAEEAKDIWTEVFMVT